MRGIIPRPFVISSQPWNVLQKVRLSWPQLDISQVRECYSYKFVRSIYSVLFFCFFCGGDNTIEYVL